MAKRKRMPTDLNQRAKAIVDFATSDEPGDEKDEKRAAGTFGYGDVWTFTAIEAASKMAAGVERYPWSVTQLAELLD